MRSRAVFGNRTKSSRAPSPLKWLQLDTNSVRPVARYWTKCYCGINTAFCRKTAKGRGAEFTLSANTRQRAPTPLADIYADVFDRFIFSTDMRKTFFGMFACFCAVSAIAGYAFRNEIERDLHPTYIVSAPWGETMIWTPWGNSKQTKICEPLPGLPTVSDRMHPVIRPRPKCNIGFFLDDKTIAVKRVTEQGKTEWQISTIVPGPQGEEADRQ